MQVRSKLARDLSIVVLLAAISVAAGLAINSLRNRPSPVPQVDRGGLPPVLETGSSGVILSLKEFRALVEGRQGWVVDARPAASYQEGHVPGAVSLPRDDFAARYADVKSKFEEDKSRLIIVYCSGYYCKDSSTVRKNLADLGYTNIFIFKRGWPAWQEAGLPEERTK